MLWRQIPLYHVSAGTAVIARIFLVFPLLDWLGINYVINTLVGVLISAALNYLISARLVFKTPVKGDRNRQQADISEEIYYPEGLTPGLEIRTPDLNRSQSKTSRKIKVLSLVIPARNEEGCIVPTVQSISQVLEEEKIAYEILVINRHLQKFQSTSVAGL